MSVTIIIPVYNEAEILSTNIPYIYDKFAEFLPVFTLILVNDGSTDKTQHELSKITEQNKKILVINNEFHYGKGHALRTGAKIATGDIICFFDCDLFVEPLYIQNLLDKIAEGIDAAIASRYIAGSVQSASLKRKISSKIFRFIRKKFFGLSNISDTQCGCKAFKKSVLKSTLEETLIHGFCYDLELLYVLNRMGYTITEVAIVMNTQKSRASRLSLVKESYRMIKDIFLIKFHHG